MANDPERGALIEYGKAPIPFESSPEHGPCSSAAITWDEPLSTRRTVACNCGRYWSTLHMPVDTLPATLLTPILETHIANPGLTDEQLLEQVADGAD